MSCTPHPNEILFTGYLRRFVLFHALKNDNYDILIQEAEQLSSLKKVKGKEYTCTCPWCGSEEGFILNKKTGDCFCSSCDKTSDLLELILESQGCCIHEAIGGLIYHLKKGGEV